MAWSSCCRREVGHAASRLMRGATVRLRHARGSVPGLMSSGHAHTVDRFARGPAGARLRLLEQFFYPEGWGGAELPRDLAVHLVRCGYRVEVICGSEQYVPVNGHAGPDPQQEGVHISRIPALPGTQDVHVRTALRQLWFCAWALPRLFLRRPPDLFISQTNPPLAVLVVALAARFWRKPCLLIAMDLYPEVLAAHGALAGRGWLRSLATVVFGWAFRSATRVVALGPVMAERIRAKGVVPARVVEISNWATGATGVVRGSHNRIRADLGLGDGLVLLYSGNLGLGHEFETLLRGFALARAQVRSLRLLFFGQGRRLADVQRLARELGLDSAVSFSGPVPASRLPELFGTADLGVVTLREGFEGLMVPSKLLGYMARGIPVLYVGPRSDADLLVRRHGCGISVRNGDAAAVAAAILEAHRHRERFVEMGRCGQSAYEHELAREPGLSRYESAVTACLGTDRVEPTP